MTRTARFLLIIVIILGVATAIYWFKPDLLSSLSALNPFIGKEDAVPMIANMTPTQTVQDNAAVATAIPGTVPGTDSTVNQSDIPGNGNNNNQDAKEEVLGPFEKEIQQRHESYKSKIYTYEPYQPPVLRNPFQQIVRSVYIEEEEEERMISALATEEAVRRFVQPELPPDTKFTGLISSGEEKLAILEIDNETYIVKEGDIILDKFFIKSIQEEKVIIEINGFEIPLKLGGGEATDD